MTQYKERVRKQALKLEAEEWANEVAGIHAHSLSSMWYDTRPQDTENGNSVLDVIYNSGLVQRQTHDGHILYFGEELKGKELVYEYLRNV